MNDDARYGRYREQRAQREQHARQYAREQRTARARGGRDQPEPNLSLAGILAIVFLTIICILVVLAWNGALG